MTDTENTVTVYTLFNPLVPNGYVTMFDPAVAALETLDGIAPDTWYEVTITEHRREPNASEIPNSSNPSNSTGLETGRIRFGADGEVTTEVVSDYGVPWR